MSTSARILFLRNAFFKLIMLKRATWWRNDLKSRVSGKLSNEQKNRAVHYFSKWFKLDAGFTAFYTTATGVYDDKYIPDDVWYTKIDPFYNDWHSAEYLDNKCYYPLIFNNVKQPSIVSMRMNGYWFGDRGVLLSETEAINMLIQKDVFVKQARDSAGGHGISFFNKGTSFQELKSKISKIPGDIVIQEAITQHPEMARLNDSSVNTIRVLSLLARDGGVRIISAIVRMGINGAKVDNASSGGITCGIKEDGKLKDIAFSAKGQHFDSHPNTGLIFSSVVIPSYNELLSKVKELHPLLPHFRLVSWDFCIDKDGDPVLIEANFKQGELDFHQLNNGPVFGEETAAILDEVFGL